MNRKLTYIIVVVAFLATGTASELVGQGKLGRVREAVRKHDTSSDSSNSRTGNDDDDRRERRRRNRNKIFPLTVGSFFTPTESEVHVVHHVAPVIETPVIGAPTIGESVIINDPNVVQESLVVQEPVAHHPVLSPDPIVIDDSIGTGAWFDWGLRLTAIGGTDFDDIGFGGIGLLLQNPRGIGIDTSASLLRESGMTFRDHLYVGDVNLVYEPVISRDLRLRVGSGINWLADSIGGEAGFNMTSGFDWKLGSRWIATGEIDFGTVGDADLLHTQISLGRRLNESVEWTVGYDYKDIGGPTIGAAFTGLRFRF